MCLSDTFFANTFPSASPRPFGEFGKTGEKSFSRFKTGKDEHNKGEQPNGGRRLFNRDPEQQNEGAERGGFGGGRRGGREDRGEYNGQRKTFGEDGERRTWRTGDREKETRWGQRESREPREQGENKFEKGPRNREGEGRYSGRRDWMSRDGIQTEGLKDNEEEKPSFKTREWRTGGRDAPRESRDSREWIRGNARVEQDPEWMDAPELEPEQPIKTHTEEDFKLWKEKMKANTGAPAEERPQSDTETFGGAEPARQDTSRHVSGSSKDAEKRVAVQDDFWANFGSDTGFKAERKSETPNPAEQVAASAAPAKKSRFFTKSEAPPASIPTPPASTQPERPASTGKSADQEGLSNLMKMLGMTAPPAPQATRTPSSMSEQSIPPKQSSRSSEGPTHRDTQSPGLPAFFDDSRAPPPPQRLDSGLMQQGRPEPPRQQSQGQESFLLGLLQTSKAPRHATPQSLSPAPGLPGHGQIPGVLRVPGLSQQQQGSVYLDDPAIASVARAPHNEQRENVRNMSHGNVPMGFFDDKQFPPQGRDAHVPGHPQLAGMPNFPQSLNYMPQQGQNPGNGGSALPQAMHDLASRRMNPPGFPGNMVGHQGNNSLPPTPLDRPGQILPQQQLQHQMLQQQQQQQQQQAQHRQQPRGPLGFAPPGLEAPSRGAPPPGMMIPPGFMEGGPGPQGFFGMGGQMSEAAAISIMQQQQAAQQAQQRPPQQAPGLRDQLFPGGAGPRIHPDLIAHGYGVGPPQGGRGGAPPPGQGPAGMMHYR